MLYLSPEVIKELNQVNSHITEVYGLPDSGVSAATIHILKELPGLSLYIMLKQNAGQLELFNRYAGHDSDRIMCCLAGTREEVLDYIDTIGPHVDYIAIDDFAYYILHEPKKTIKNYIALLYARALKVNARILLLNQLRFDVWSQSNIKYPNRSETPLKTLYFDYLSPKVDYRVEVTRGSDEDNQNIYVRPGNNIKANQPHVQSRLLNCLR